MSNQIEQGADIEYFYRNARKIKPKYNLSAKQMDETIERKVLFYHVSTKPGSTRIKFV